MKHANRWILSLVVVALAVIALPAYAEESAGTVNVNAAGVDELALLPRIGPAIAQRIVDFREENGPFKAAEDLMLVRGIGEKTFELLEPYVRLDGETTLSEKVRVSRSSAAGSDEDASEDA